MTAQDYGILLGLLGFIGGVIRFEYETIRHNRERAEELRQLQQQTTLLIRIEENTRNQYPNG